MRLEVLFFASLLLVPRPLLAQDIGLDSACAAGNSSTCMATAARLFKTGKLFSDSVRAAAHLLKACQLGDGLACNDYGVSLITGRGMASNPDASARYYLRGCDLGNWVACGNYGYNLMLGQFGLSKDEVKGASYLTKSCDADNQNACVNLGLAEGRGVLGRTPQDGLTRLIRACDRFSANGCLQAGFQLRDSVGVPADLPASASYFKRACDQSVIETDSATSGDGCASLALAYEKGIGVTPNTSRGTTLYRRGCDLGSGYACTGLGILYTTNLIGPPDTGKAVALYAKSCELKHAAGCGNYGHELTIGWSGRPPDTIMGRRLLDESCKQGFILGCSWLASVDLRAGRDTAAALAIYQVNCDKGELRSCVELGEAYSLGRGMRPDDRKAFTLFERACTGGDTVGCNDLGVLLSSGQLDLRDLLRANRVFEQECSRANFRACANLGYSYEFGRGVPLDESRAVKLYEQACLSGDAYGCTLLKRLAPDSVARSLPAAPPRGPGESLPTARRGLWALVVGLSHYSNPEIRPLSYARKDAEAFARFLMSANGGGFPTDHVQLLVDQQATADALRRGLHSFLRRANQGDLVVIYFAGHGRQPGNEGGIPYFLTWDTDPREMGATAVPMDELRRAVQQSITARYIVAFIDACHSGGVTLSTRGSSDNDLINRYLRELSRSKETVVTFAASQENQESLEGPEYGGGHGAFTWNLLQALGGEADRVSEGGDESGTVTLSELAEYVSRKVKASTRNLQEPSISYLKWDPSLVLSVLRPR